MIHQVLEEYNSLHTSHTGCHKTVETTQQALTGGDFLERRKLFGSIQNFE